MIRSLFRLLLAVVAAALSFTVVKAASPESKGISTLVPELEKFINEGMEKTGVPGVAVGIVYQDRVVYLNGFGVRKTGTRQPITPDTVFQIASVSKPLASTVVASLVGLGSVKFDDLISKLDPDFRLSNPWISSQLTIRDLLSHRSGLGADSGGLLEDLGYSRPEILHRLRFLPIKGKFRTDYAYTNFGYTEGALAAASRQEERWEDVMDRYLYKPLGMKSTSSRFSDYFNAENKAFGHAFENGKAVNRFLRQPDSESPAGGVSSTVRDLTQWLRLQLRDGMWEGQQIVDAEALRETHKPEIVSMAGATKETTTYYGMGWDVSTDGRGKTILSHSGAFLLGTGTNVTLSQSDQLAIVVLTNAAPVGLAEAIAKTFFDYYVYGHSTKDWLQLYGAVFQKMTEESNNASTDYSKLQPPASPTPARPLETYAGKYRNDYYGTAEISAVGNQLYLLLPPRGAAYPLTHWDGDIFTYRFEAELGIGTRGVDFKGNDRMLIENLATETSGIFTRVSHDK